MTTRENTRALRVGNVAVGGGAPVSVQSMANVPPHDAAALAAQIESCAACGCDIFRVTVPDEAAAQTLGEVAGRVPIPLVADIHFDWRMAVAAAENGAAALRINPGNIGGADKVREVVRAAKARKIPIRVGVNLGSLQKNLAEKTRAGKMRPAEALCSSALEHLAILEKEGFRDVAISAKASDAATTIETYRLLAERTDCPLHLGVTEAGTLLPGAVRSAAALGILLSEGIGDTIRISLTDRPEREVKAGAELLRALGMRAPGPAIVSCPTCGRTKADLFRVAAEVEETMEALYSKRLAEAKTAGRAGAPAFPKVAVMGCAVNGPGEAKDADIALCGCGDGDFMVYVKGEPVCRTSAAQAAGKVAEYAISL